MNDAVVAYSLASMIFANTAGGLVAAGHNGSALGSTVLAFMFLYFAGWSYEK